jgi:hypothetical protein
MKLQDLLQITNAIKSMNNSELNAVVDAVNQAKRRQSVFSSANFSVGQKVIFGRTPSGLQRVGVIQKMNPAKAVVQVYDNRKKRVQDWRVPYSLMKGVA